VSNARTATTITAFSTATTARDYRAAKAAAARLGRDEQLAVVDSMIAACRRLRAAGAL
jgi:hypothetical protein